ncbi:uncharacterized protein LOC123306725 [Coccinella septempunctata]|uniref:uncharacterized protein LOC123306725 n=1 Tax=Coccinella septempunctata TaxID=41139 RepID=UPI001D05D359|nr:uncharacterized protein LOC123306725 [Coccinella septempunctata]
MEETQTITSILDGKYQINVIQEEYERSMRGISSDPEYCNYLLSEAQKTVGNATFNESVPLETDIPSCSYFKDVAVAPEEDLTSSNVWSYQKTICIQCPPCTRISTTPEEGNIFLNIFPMT